MTSFAELVRANVARYREERAAVWAAEREAQERAEREQQAEQAARMIRPAAVDPTATEQAKEQATGLLALMRRFQDAKAKFQSLDSQIEHWTVARIETDDDLDRAIAVRDELESSSSVLALDGRGRLSQKVSELNAQITSAKGRFLYSMAEPVFRTDSLFADSLFNQHRCHRVSNRNEKCFVLSMESLEASDSKTAQRITDLFTACGAEFFPGQFGPSVVLEAREILRSMNPAVIEYAPPDSKSIDGIEGILKPTTRALEWHQEREAERQREETARQEAEREAARKEHETKLAEFRELMAEAQQQQQQQQQQQPIAETENV